MNTKQKKWIAVVLSIFAAPLAFLYLDAPLWALVSFVVPAVVAIAGFMKPGHESELLTGLISLALLVLWVWRAWRFVAQKSGEEVRPWYSRWHGLVAVGVAVAVAIILIRVFLYEPFRAPSSSMMPTIPTRSNLLVQKWGYGHYTTMMLNLGHGTISAPIAHGDIIVFDFPRDPKQSYIKRVIGLPGDKIVYHDKHVLVNGVDTRTKALEDFLNDQVLVYMKRYREKLDQNEYDILINDSAPWWSGDITTLPQECSAAADTLSCTVPAGHYFVMGDNRDNSFDSRYWGFVSANAVIGKIVYVAKPVN